MARPIRKEYSNSYQHLHSYNTRKYAANVRPANISKKRVKKTNKNFFATVLQLLFALVFVCFVSPVYVDQVTRPVFLRTNKYPNIVVDYNTLYKPTSKYLYNNNVLGVNLLSSTEIKKPLLHPLYETYRLSSLESQLKNLIAQYPTLKPSVYVWDYESGKYADIRADEEYSAASIIKIPVLLQVFKSIEMGMFRLDDKIKMTDYYLSEGSGSLQFKGANAEYTVDELAKVMITESDNSATNILLDMTGGMNAMNQSLRKWGLSVTRINDWLPDMSGTNVTTSREIATMLYNLDNTNFLSLNSREKMVDYMGHVHNNRLIHAGLPSDAIFIHKTGDIGKMLGDAGIVYASNGKKYIVVMLVNRPYNSFAGKEFIVSASNLVYNFMINTTF